ncbi:hypothetical protein [Halorubrum trapanicum]|nr:hypothetical protein [Halorubrum trapanicum]
MESCETTTRSGSLPKSAGTGAVGTAVVWEADATHYVDDLSVRVEAR